MALTKVLTGGLAADSVDNTILKLDDDYALTGAVTGAGTIVQVVNVTTGASATGSVNMPYNDTIPQIDEGTEFMTLAITPTNASNKLLIQVSAHYQNSAAGHTCMALFVGTTANALASIGTYHSAANWGNHRTFNHFMAAGATSELTFRVRIGRGGTGTITFNGEGGSRDLGGTAASSITITEIAV